MNRYHIVEKETPLTSDELNNIKPNAIAGFTYDCDRHLYVYIFADTYSDTLCVGNADNTAETAPREEAPIDLTMVTPHRFMFKNALISLGVTPQTATDWIKVRQAKKAAQTETAFNIIKREVAAVCNNYGVTADDAIKVAIDRNWQGIKATWFDNVDWAFYGVQVGHTDLPFDDKNNWE